MDFVIVVVAVRSTANHKQQPQKEKRDCAGSAIFQRQKDTTRVLDQKAKNLRTFPKAQLCSYSCSATTTT
jgi:hypothetical protein